MKIYTVGTAAKICGVAPRAMSKWCDAGKISSYRLPHADDDVPGDRRIYASALRAFARKYDLPILGIGEGVLAAGFAPGFTARLIAAVTGLEAVAGPVELAFRVGHAPPDLVLIDTAIEGTQAEQFILVIRSIRGNQGTRLTPIWVVCGEQQKKEDWIAAGADRAILRPVDEMQLVADVIRQMGLPVALDRTRRTGIKVCQHGAA